MPDLQEVFRMATQKVDPDPGALQRQHRFQRRTTTRRKLGAFALAAALGVAALVLILATRPGENVTAPASAPPSVNPADAAGERIARRFITAFGASDMSRALTYVADDADLSGVTNGVGGVKGLSLMTSWLEAQDYQQTITSCQAGSLVSSDTTVICAFDFHGIRSDEIGRGPFSGSTFTITVTDGAISRASMEWDTQKFSPQMWEPFADWVISTYPRDAVVMYTDGTLSDFRLTQKSIRLWELRSKEYVREVQRGNVG
jgi:hypothetical protein